MRSLLPLLLLPTFLTTLPAAPKTPLRLAIAGLSHSHVHWLLGRPERGDLVIVGIYEPNRDLAARYFQRYGLDQELLFDDFETMLETVKPEAVTAFGSIDEHLRVVEGCAPRGIHVMVEKPLAVANEPAARMAELARRHRIHLLTNYETTWYASVHALRQKVSDGEVGPIRKIVVHDGHSGPQEIGVNKEFLEWLTDPKRNGAGALTDFGCYGADLIAWLMGGAAPLSVTAVTQQIKPEIYPKVDDEATIIVTYPQAQGIIQASWNWPFNRKDMEVYGLTGSIAAPDGQTLQIRTQADQPESIVRLAPRSAPNDDPFGFLAAVVRGDLMVEPTDLSSLDLNLTVVRILDAARESARTGRTVKLGR